MANPDIAKNRINNFAENKINNFENKVAERVLILTNKIIDRAPREIALKGLAMGDILKAMSEERRAELKLKVRDAVRELKLFVSEISPLFEGAAEEKSAKESGTSVEEKKD